MVSALEVSEYNGLEESMFETSSFVPVSKERRI